MKRREVITFLGAAVLWPLTARAQTQATINAAADNQVGQVATLQGSATVTRANAAAALLKVSDAIHKGDELQTGANSSLGITFDDETTLSLSANTRIVVNEFIYREGGKGNRGLFNAARGTLAFVAGLLAKSGEMKITTETAVIGRRGRGGQDQALSRCRWARGTARSVQPAGRAARHFDAGCERVRDPAWRRRTSGRCAVPDSAAGGPRDRAVVQRLFASHNIGRQMAIQRRQSRRQQQQNRQPERPRPNLPKRNPTVPKRRRP